MLISVPIKWVITLSIMDNFCKYLYWIQVQLSSLNISGRVLQNLFQNYRVLLLTPLFPFTPLPLIILFYSQNIPCILEHPFLVFGNRIKFSKTKICKFWKFNDFCKFNFQNSKILNFQKSSVFYFWKFNFRNSFGTLIQNQEIH